MGSISGSKRARQLWVAALLAEGVLGVACSREPKSTSAPAPSASFSPEEESRLAAALAAWRTRWEREPAPPSCTALLKEPADLALCTEAAARLVTVKERSAALGRDAATLRAAAELAVAASHAERKLRLAAMEYLGSQGAAAASAPPRPSAAPGPSSPPAPQSTPSASARAAFRKLAALSRGQDGGVEADAVQRDNPYTPVLKAFSVLSAGALRYLAAFLEQGPLPLRAQALSELERIAHDHEPWHPLQQVVRQAHLLEHDPTLKARLGKLDRLPVLPRPERRE